MSKPTFIVKYNDIMHKCSESANPRGLTKDEAISLIKKNNWRNVELINLKKEIEKYKLKKDSYMKKYLTEEEYDYYVWSTACLDNNINGFSLPMHVNTNGEYIVKLEDTLKKYLCEVKKPAFIYEEGLIEDIENNCNKIMQIMKMLVDKNFVTAEKYLTELMTDFSRNSFMVSELDKCYSFRQIAPFLNLRNEKYKETYEKMLNKELTFFRVRTKKKVCLENITEVKHIVHLPYEMKNKATEMRFSCKDVPCLYLGTTSYVCCKECNWDKNFEEAYASAFVPNTEGKKLKILNLTISQALINGISDGIVNDENKKDKQKLQNAMLKLFPLVIATSFSIDDKTNREIKYEYLISQALMRVIRTMGIDGVAYLSMKGEDEFQYPHGVNLALPAFDITKEKQYSKYCEMFNISVPVQFNNQTSGIRESYINAIFKKKNEFGMDDFTSRLDVDGVEMFYGDSLYGKFDDFIVSQNLEKFVE